MTSSTNFKVTRNLDYTATKPKSDGKPNHINEDVLTYAISEGFLKYAAVFDGAGGSGQGLTKSGRTQAYVVANFLATKAPSFLDFSEISPTRMPTEIKKREATLKKLFEELVANQALPNEATNLRISGDPSNKRFPTTLAAVVSDSEGGLHVIFQGDSQIFGLFEKRIMPLSLVSDGKLTPSANNLCFVDVGNLQKENEKTLGILRGIIICSDGFLENNSAFGFPYDDVIYTNLQTAYNITLNENVEYSKKQFKTFLDRFVGNDDKSLISLVFEPTTVIKEPFYLQHTANKFKNQIMLTDELSQKQRLLVLSSTNIGNENKENPVIVSNVVAESQKGREKGFGDKVTLEYFYVQNQANKNVRACLSLETIMMALASKDLTGQNSGLAETLEAVSSAKMFFDTTHLVATPLGLLASDTYFKADIYENIRKTDGTFSNPIEMGRPKSGTSSHLCEAHTAYLSVPAENRNDFGCVYLEERNESLPETKIKMFTLDTSSFDYVCLVIRDWELPFFKTILEKIPFSQVTKFRIFTIKDTQAAPSIEDTLQQMQGLNKNIMNINDKRSPGEQFLDFIEKLVLGNKTSIHLQTLEEHKRIFNDDQMSPTDDGQFSLF